MRRRHQHLATTATVLAATMLAYAIGNGDIRPNPEVAVITITSTTSGGNGATALQNTTSATTYNVLVGPDATCDPAITFNVSGGNPASIAAQTSRQVTIGCPIRGVAAMRRCLYHATNNASSTALADFMGVCVYGSSPGTLTPQQPLLDFGTVPVGGSAQLLLDIQNESATQITHVYVQTNDLAGNFQFSTPCNPDGAFCDEDLPAAVGSGNTMTLRVKCTPQTAGNHTAQVFIGTNTFQLMSTGVMLQCIGGTATVPVLSANPASIELGSPVEVTTGNANVVVHLSNAGDGALLVNDVRTVDVDIGAALDWSYSASGGCSGLIPPTACTLDAGKQVDINLNFDPSAIGRRRATLLISYHDTVDRTKEIALDATGLGATLQLASGSTSLAFGMVPTGRVSPIDVKLANRGNRDTTAQLALTPSTTPPFSLAPSSSAVVTPTVDKSITVSCAPIAVGLFSTTITAQSMDAFSSSPITLTASCEGSSFQLYSNPSAIVLGDVRIGAGPVQRTVQLLSTASPSQLTLTGQPTLEASDPNVSIGPASQLATPATFGVTITPSKEGQLNHVILVSDSDGETLRIPISGRIVDAKYDVASAVDLGTFCVNQPTTSSNVSLLSSGTATIGLAQPTLGLAPSPFQLAMITPSSYPSSLPGGTAARVAITPQRQTAVATLADTMTWHTDVEGMTTAATELMARFLDSGGAIAPPALDFGKVLAHLYVDNGQRVIIQNCNDTPLELQTPTIPAPFSIDSPNFPKMLNPNETTTFSVGFHPTRIGPVAQTLQIMSPQLVDAPLLVNLYGEGMAGEIPPDAGDGPKDFGHTSFYACACNGPSAPAAGWPVVLAIVLIGRRRRGSS